MHHAGLAFTTWGWFGVVVSQEPGPIFQAINDFSYWFLNSFGMCILFLMAGYFTPRSVHKKGIKGYLKDRLLRIGLPFLFGLLLINNLTFLVGDVFPTSVFKWKSWAEFPFNHITVLWYLVMLFGFELLYCVFVALRSYEFEVDDSVALPGVRYWVISAVVLALLEVLMGQQTWLWRALTRSPLDGLGIQGAHSFTYGFLFAVGCKAASHRWLERIDVQFAVRWFRVSVFLSLVVLGIVLVLALQGDLAKQAASEINRTVSVADLKALKGDLAKQVARFDVLKAALNPFVGWGVMAYLLVWKQRHEALGGHWLAQAGVDSYGAYIIHSLLLVFVMGVISLVDLNDWVSWLLGSVLGIVLSFGVSHQLRRIPVVRRVV